MRKHVLAVVSTFVLGLTASACTSRLGEVEVGEAVADEAVAAEWRAAYTQALAFNMQRLLDCYDEALGKKPKLAGRIELAVTLGAPAQIAVAANGTGDERLARCIATAAPTKVYLPEGATGQLILPLELRPR